MFPLSVPHHQILDIFARDKIARLQLAAAHLSLSVRTSTQMMLAGKFERLS